MGAAGCQHRAVGLEVSAAHDDDTVPQLTVDTLVVELLEDLLEVAREIHGPKSERQAEAERGEEQSNVSNEVITDDGSQS